MSTLVQPEPEEPLVVEVSGYPAFPPGVLAHDTVDLDAEDPAHVEERPTRQCVGVRQDGHRCGGVAMNGHLLCALHTGLVDAAEGGRAKARKMREARQEAERELARRSLGTRATIAAVLEREHLKLEATLTDLLTKAAAGDQKAQALLPAYINQGYGQPTERVEHSHPQSEQDVEAADTASLEAMVAEGRRRRLSAVPDA